jgi:tRNA nucleotidyltransferase (CCA-adding enzyme)
MKNYLVNLNKELQDLIKVASCAAEHYHLSIYLVGGFVRDLILGVKNLDLDIVVEGDGIKFAEEFANRLNASLILHRRFGTATVVLESKLKIDIASARKEHYPKAASLPEVTAGTLEDDLFRRDFTINTMAISITKNNFGNFIDLFGGKADLNNKKIRVLHNLSFIDDPTRILRAIRFEKRYGFKIDAETLKALSVSVRLKMLEKVQPQRLRDELILTLKETKPIKEIERIQQLAGFKFINPSLSLTKGSYQLLKNIEAQINWFKKRYPQRRTLDTWLVYFIGLIDPLGLREIKSICKKFVFRRGEEKRILAYKKVGERTLRYLSQAKIKPSGIFELLEPLSYEIILILKAKSRYHNIKRNIENFLRAYNGMQLYVSGEDLCRLGIKPGPHYKKIFSKALTAKIDGRIKTKDDEIDLIRRLKINSK